MGNGIQPTSRGRFVPNLEERCPAPTQSMFQAIFRTLWQEFRETIEMWNGYFTEAVNMARAAVLVPVSWLCLSLFGLERDGPTRLDRQVMLSKPCPGFFPLSY